MTPTTPLLAPPEQAFLEDVKTAFAQSTLDFARSYYLFATARLEKTYNSSEIYARYPMLQEEGTFKRLKPLYDAHPENEEIKRLFVDALGTYIGNRFAAESDEITNLKDKLEIDVADMGLVDKSGQPVEKILYEDTSEWFKTITDKAQRETLYQRVAEAHTREIAPLFVSLFQQENALLAELGYPDVVAFYTQASGHNLKKLGEKAAQLVIGTAQEYLPNIAAFYEARIGLPFDQASRADIAFVFHGKSEEMAAIDGRFPESNLVPLARKTFDQLGLAFSEIAEIVDFPSKEAYTQTVDNPARKSRILLDIANREGKRSRAYVYPARSPEEIYLSVKPEGGLDDYSAFFHESGHAQHFAYVQPGLSFPLALMGNNTVTESYAYLFQNLFLNRYWLVNEAGLTDDAARQVIRRTALTDLYMLRRYASKMQFELSLYDGAPLTEKGPVYARLLTEGTGFRYDAESWTRDVDHGFYVADYFTAWTLEAQLREYLQQHYGTPANEREDWYQNPEAGAFLKALWKDGNLTQADLSARLAYNDPTDVAPLMRLMQQNLNR